MITTKKRFTRLITLYKEHFYYGGVVDSWLPNITLIPYITLGWKTKPIWFRCIAPPGAGKSAHLELLRGHPLTYWIDNFTPKSFISGYKTEDGKDMSKLPRMNGKVVIVSDESTLMEQRLEDRNQVLAILRGVYDGTASKDFGNEIETKTYNSRFNMLIGSTPQIDRYFQYVQALGERFLNYRLQVQDRMGIAERALSNQFKAKNDTALKAALHDYLYNLPNIAVTQIDISDKYIRYCLQIGEIIARIRTHVTRDYTGREVTTVPQAEVPSRIALQISQVAAADAIVMGNSHVKLENVKKATYLGLCSATAMTIFVLYNIYRLCQELGAKEAWFKKEALMVKTALSIRTVDRELQDLSIHRIIEIRRSKNSHGLSSYEYRLSEEMIDYLDSFSIFNDYIPPIKEIITYKNQSRFSHKTNSEKTRKVKKKDD